jgi:hypothetical protein
MVQILGIIKYQSTIEKCEINDWSNVSLASSLHVSTNTYVTTFARRNIDTIINENWVKFFQANTGSKVYLPV